jgi:hypothetical protein
MYAAARLPTVEPSARKEDEMDGPPLKLRPQPPLTANTAAALADPSVPRHGRRREARSCPQASPSLTPGPAQPGASTAIKHQEISMHRPAQWAAVIAAAVALAACGTPAVAGVAPGGSARAVKTLTYYAFDVNNGPTDPGFIPAPGTNPKIFSQGDELIINDQLTTTHQVNGGYPIVGHDAGVCTLTRIPQKHAEQTLANCVVTAVWNNGSLTVQGVIRFQSRQPEPAVLPVTGGTGRFDGAAGTAGVSFTKNFKILTIKLK